MRVTVAGMGTDRPASSVICSGSADAGPEKRAAKPPSRIWRRSGFTESDSFLVQIEGLNVAWAFTFCQRKLECFVKADIEPRFGRVTQRTAAAREPAITGAKRSGCDKLLLGCG